MATYRSGDPAAASVDGGVKIMEKAKLHWTGSPNDRAGRAVIEFQRQELTLDMKCVGDALALVAMIDSAHKDGVSHGVRMSIASLETLKADSTVSD